MTLQNKTTGLNEIQDRLTELFASELPSINPALPFLDQINSLELLEVVGIVQKKFAVRIEDIEISEKNFVSVQALAEFLGRKLAAVADENSRT